MMNSLQQPQEEVLNKLLDSDKYTHYAINIKNVLDKRENRKLIKYKKERRWMICQLAKWYT
ncbi:hypothetical protein M153_2549000998 [Pseudoloma neurophilia]|uniref:Uncharacterized protein n=1 Tax=Pseudoloma neurophilia TaxID=146866 RepID=A0A0R0M050_9MICR|nr:hypothetical protein M153_2549000998 [Pseudoloma neurophilia]